MTAKILVPLCALACLLAARAPEKIFPFRYSQEDLPNGLRLISIPTDYPNIVALYIVVNAGSRNEVEPGKSGFAHLFEHMMFRGTERFPSAKYDAEIRKAGAASNAFTQDDVTVYHTTFSKEDLENMLMMEADRFQNLKYSEAAFKTEALAVLGEYNKNSAAPQQKLFEVLRDTAFTKHTYKHTTMGFLKDIQAMPNEYEYSLTFFSRYYRPEYTTIVAVGDIEPARVRGWVDKYWGNWKRGSYRAQIPAEPPQTAPRTNHIDWPTPTLPWISIAFHVPAYDDLGKDTASLDVLAALGFSENSPLYQKLVIQEQKVDVLFGGAPDHVDPGLFTISTRVKKESDMNSVRDQILETLSGFVSTPVEKNRLEAVKNHLRYEVSLQMNNSEAIAGLVAHYVGLRRTPETMNRVYDLYAQITPEDVVRVARAYLVEKNSTIVTLTGSKSQ